MATKNYDNFDFDEYQRNLNKSNQSGNRTSYDNYDFDDAYIRQNLPKVGEYITSSLNSWIEDNAWLNADFNSRFRPDNTSYRGDTSDWYSKINTRTTNLKTKADEIKSLVEQYKDYLSEDFVSSVMEQFDKSFSSYDDMIKVSSEDQKYWSQWETEDAYNEYIKWQEDQNAMLNFDLTSGKKEIESLQKIVDTFDSFEVTPYRDNRSDTISTPSRTQADRSLMQWAGFANAYGMSYEEAKKFLSDTKAQLSEKSAYYTLAERAQNAERLASVADVNSENYDPEFEKYAAKGKELGKDPDKWWQNPENEIAHMRNDPQAIKSYEESANSANGASFGLVENTLLDEITYKAAKHMWNNEFDTYNYYLAKDKENGTNLAEEYLNSIEETLNKRQAAGIVEELEGHPVLQYLFGIEAGIDQFASGVEGLFADGYTPASGVQMASGVIRENLEDNGIPLWYNFKEGKWENKILGTSSAQIGYDILNTTSNMLPSILASTVSNIIVPGSGAVVGAGLMGASAGGNAKVEMLNLGYSKEQANTYGAMVAIAEGSMEYLLGGITKLGGVLPDGITGKILTKVDNAFARAAIKIGGSMASEGFEEGLQTVIEPWLKEIATGVDWDDPNIDEVLYSSLLGALSAVGLEGSGVVAGEVSTYKAGKKIRNTNGGVGMLQNIATNENYFSADSVAYKIASKVDATTDAYTIGRLLKEVGGSISEQNVTDIANGLIAKNIDSKTANKLARQYQAILNSDMNISNEAKDILNNIPGLNSVLRENLINKNTTVYQRTKAYSDLMSLAEETTNQKKGKTSESKIDSLESLANSMAARGVDSNVAGVMAMGVKSELDSTKPTTTQSSLNVFEQKTMNDEIQKIASEVSSGRRATTSDAIKKSVNSASDIAAERLGVEGKYASSETGATRLASNKQKVNIVGVDSISDGTMKLKLDDGSVVDASDINFSTSDQALVYEAVANMGVSANTAWEILKGYDPKSGQSGTIYAMGALEAYTYGHNGVKVEGMSQDGFSSLLSPVQKNTANRLGDIDARAKVESQQKTIDKAVKSVRDEAKSKHKPIEKRKGGIVFEGDHSSLKDHQKSQLDVLEKVAEGLGVTFHIFKSEKDANGKIYYKMPNGKYTSANGWYDPKTGEIWLDLNAGNDGQGTMIFTAAHELTHFIRQWSPAKFKVFADFLFEQYGKKGQNVNQLIQNQIQKAANNGRTISWDEAYEEVVADSCETFLRDSKAAEKIAALREKDINLANKIKTFLGQMLAKMRKVMADLGLAPETPEGQMVAEMTDSLQKLYDLWTDALADAGTAYSTLANINLDTESVAPMLSERTWTASEYVTEREETAKKIAKALGVDIKTAYKYIDDINSVARLIADDRARLDYEPNLDEHATVLKPNSDYKYSVDMSTLCAKRLLFTGTFDAIQRALPNTVFDSEDIVALREMMQKRGYEVACGICYVESTRREIGRITQDFINSYKESQKTGKPITRTNSEGKVIDLKKTNDEKASTADKSTDKFFAEKDYTPTLADLNTTDIDLVKRDHPLVYEAYLNFMNARGQAKPKLLETRAEYKGEILKHFKVKSAVTSRNNAGGLRLQSFSDFEVPHLIDMMQIVMDMSRVGLKSQAYTKVPAFAEVFGDTGVKINLSLIAKGDGLDANGNLIFDDVEGINHKEAFKLRDKYSKNVGTILVGKTDAHIIAAMADPRIDYIIPFHKSSWKESLYDALGLTGYADYTETQHEKPIDKSRKISDYDPSEYWDFSKSGDENAQIYLEKCREDGRIPKFPQFQGYPGYWKLLIDFKMYDNDGIGSPQEIVRPTFNTEASERILSEYKGGHKSFPVAKDVVEDFVKEHEDKVKFSDRVLMGSLFSGGGTLEAGLVYQMLDKEFAVEYNKKIASTYTDNHGKEHMFVGDVREFNSKEKQSVFYLHASPVCKNFSPASHGGGETTLDITTAKATARVLEEQMPQVFTVENVKRYIGSEAYNLIINKLNELGYTWDVAVYKASDYGNATKRERMIIRAVKDGELPAKPQKASNITSWGEATRDLWETDLIPSYLVQSKIAAINNTPQLKGIDIKKLDKPLMIYDTTKSKTAIFAWADELAPTLTTKCGDARIIMPDGKVYAPTPRFMGRIQGLPDDYKYPKATTNAFKIIGNGIPTQLTKAVMGGVLDSAYEQTHDGEVLYSDRSPSAVSTRTLLANALETTAQNDIERNKLEQYKKKIELIEAEQAKLAEIKKQANDIRFTKGRTSAETKQMKALEFEANQIANRINVYDRQLLNLESTTALKNVLQREKELARRKEAKKGKEALAKYKEKAAKTQRELMDRNTESRKKAIEGRNKTEMRGKIKKVVGDLKALLLNPTKDKHVPIGLQKSVAEALDVINMDTMGADERVAKYDAMIAKANDPDIIAELKKSRDRIALQGANLSDKLTALKQAYAEIKNSDDSLIRDSYNEAIEDLIANTAKKVGNTSLRDMSYEQLEAVYDMYKAILATVRNANKLFKANIQEIITDNSEAVKREVRAAGGHRDRVLKATKFLKKFGWNMLKPIYAMKLIGSDTLTRLYENVRKGEDTWAVDVNEAKDFFKETAKKYEYNVWDFEKQYKFADSAGHTFSLTLEQIMSLYAYSKRSQADKHLEVGGFIFDDAIEVKEKKHGITLTYEVNDADPYRLKKEDLARIIDLLESQMPNVKGFVDEMQAYLSDVMGAKGNEVSLAMYDIKLYKEQNYFPLKTAKYFREFDPEKNGTPKIKNSGFSKKTEPQAGNPIILSNFMDVWANHVNDMSMYHAFVLPLEDFMRVYNYSSTAGGYDSVQQYIKNAYGSQANTYIETLMNDLNGGARTDPATDLIGKGMSLFKKAAVFASASVVIQQPSAIARALAYVDAKYFVDKPEATKHSETWAEVKKYAPVAIIKEMGYFDTNMGRSTVDWIKEEKTWRDKVDDIASKAPALADELAWCAIWKAVKREIADTTNLKVGSEEFLRMAGKRFTEVVTKTQVYDSVLSRSALMRSKDSGAKMVTAFMAEPTTSLNMVVDAIIEGKRGNKKFAGKVIGAVASSIILNSILVSLVTAARDDDEDETYLEKYLGSLTAELLDGFNPLTYIPLIKDIWSIMQGYDIERSDMSIWSDLWQSVENLFSENKSGFEKTEGVVGSIASVFGLPLKNILKDARGMYNLGKTLLSGTPTTGAGIGDAVGGAVKNSIPLYSRIEKWVGADESKSDKLYDAIMSGDQNQIDRIKAQYKDDKAVESAIRQGLRENDPRIKEAAQARYDGDIDEYKRIAKDIISEGNFSQDTIVAAINAEINAIKKDEPSEEADDSTEKVTSIYKASDINSAFESGDTEMALEVIEDLFNTKVENYLADAKKEAEESGKRFNERTAKTEAESKAKSSIRTSMTSYWKPLYKKAYKDKDTAEQERIKRILKDSGMYGNTSEVIKTIREWRSERD